MSARASGGGTAATEWRFQVQPPGKVRRSLVPDVGYLSYERMSRAEQELTDAPAMAPDAVVEVLSPEDRQRDIEEKVRVYLAAGTSVIFLVNTENRTVEIRDPEGTRLVAETEDVTHRSLPGLRFVARSLFEAP